MKYVFDTEYFRTQIKQMRLIDKEIGMREASKQAKISPATFSRLENGNTTDMDTFIKMCNWLKMSPSVFFKAATKQKNTI